jgi:diacylglycerol kinase family enzyme
VRFANIIKYYKNGEYLDHPKLQDIVSHCRGKRVTIESNRLFYIGIDGELLHGNRFKIENLPRALRFVVPCR